MDLSKIMTIAGKSGLYKVLSETRQGMLVESMTDGKKTHVFASDRSSLLEDISLFTTEGDKPLKEVLWMIHEHEGGKALPDPKLDAGATKAKFEELLPDYDKNRVYFSDMKKVFAWYNLLLEKGLITRPEEEEGSGDEPPTGDDGDAGNKEQKAPSADKDSHVS
ncbi:MAG: DUF5606 domain-containing protein [Bacteroidales bacterium]|nr:DUF5606 domain-containing protein [Bacteroidales bacterium]